MASCGQSDSSMLHCYCSVHTLIHTCQHTVRTLLNQNDTDNCMCVAAGKRRDIGTNAETHAEVGASTGCIGAYCTASTAARHATSETPPCDAQAHTQHRSPSRTRLTRRPSRPQTSSRCRSPYVFTFTCGGVSALEALQWGTPVCQRPAPCEHSPRLAPRRPIAGQGGPGCAGGGSVHRCCLCEGWGVYVSEWGEIELDGQHHGVCI